MNNSDVVVIKKKRGRKSKKELALLKKLEKENKLKNEVKVPKKRGRKPKGGKIIKTIDNTISPNTPVKENVILHLKCKSEQLNEINNMLTNMDYEPNINDVKPYNNNDNDMNLISNVVNGSNNVIPQHGRQYIELTVTDNNTYQNDGFNQTEHNTTKTYDEPCLCDETTIWKKIKYLNNKLHNNKISDKNSSCFWCSCEFTTPPIYIPKSFINNTYEVYGSFCMPECAVGYLFRENIDNTTRWERYAMLNTIYSGIFNYDKNIKPAPEPYYILDKYYGTLSIDEYRKLMRSDKLLMVVDKPLTRVLPELYDDNNEFNINNSSLQSNKQSQQYKLKRTKKKISKHDVNFFNV